MHAEARAVTAAVFFFTAVVLDVAGPRVRNPAASAAYAIAQALVSSPDNIHEKA